MKKILMMLFAMLMLMPTVSEAKSKSELEKQRAKEYKIKMKEFKKEGWKLFGSTRSLEVALLTHYEKLNQLGEDGVEKMGYATVTDSKHKNLLKQVAIANACNTYARDCGSHVKGRTANDMGLTDEEKSEFEHFYAAYESLVEKEIRGEMRESFSVIKEVNGKQIDLQVFYIIDESAASRARIRAFENAKKESEVAQKYAQQVSDFISEGFDEEE